jgi:hypothetical protein
MIFFAEKGSAFNNYQICFALDLTLDISCRFFPLPLLNSAPGGLGQVQHLEGPDGHDNHSSGLQNWYL